jgi:hypothetical protein
MKLKFWNFIRTNYGFLGGILIYFLILLLVSPFGEHAVNDDWQFYTHVRYFLEGNFVKNSVIDASFILQGFIALGWVKIWGLSFLNLRILTIIFTIIFLIGFYKVLKFYRLKNLTVFISFLALFIEPLFLTSSFSFMTEIYFLTFSIWSFYFYLLGTKDSKLSSYFYFTSILLGSLTILIRQFGIVLFIAYLILFSLKKNKKYLYLTLTTLLFSLTIYVNFIFPQYEGDFDSKEEKIISLFVSSQDLLDKLIFYPKYLVYLVFYLSPFILSLRIISKKSKLISAILAFLIAIPIFSIDIFDLKNIFHIECLYCETQFTHSTSLFDNLYFKFALSIILGYLISTVLISLYQAKIWKKVNFTTNISPELIISLGMFGVIYFVDSFYERYFLNFAIFFIIYLATKLDLKITFSKFSLIIPSLFLLIVVFLNIDFYRSISVRWKLSDNLKNMTGLEGEIFTVGSFYRFTKAQSLSPKDYKSSTYRGGYKCYVIRHVSGENNILTKWIGNNKIPKLGYIDNPTFSNTGLKIKIPKDTFYLQKVIQIEEYNSPIFNLIGRKTYILSFCEDKVTQEKNIPVIDRMGLK